VTTTRLSYEALEDRVRQALVANGFSEQAAAPIASSTMRARVGIGAR